MAERPATTRLALAHHEAGHAVIAVRRGERFGSVDLIQEGDSRGGMRGQPAGGGLDQLERDLDIRLAGPIAQALYEGKSPAEIRDMHAFVILCGRFGGASDRKLADRWSEGLAWVELGPDANREAAEKRGWEIACAARDRVVLELSSATTWASVQQVAAALDREGLLKEEDVLTLAGIG